MLNDILENHRKELFRNCRRLEQHEGKGPVIYLNLNDVMKYIARILNEDQ